jgi:hypothetical protein
LACFSRAINASTVGAAAEGLVVLVFALFAPVLVGGPPHAGKNIDATDRMKRVIFFTTNLPGII